MSSWRGRLLRVPAWVLSLGVAAGLVLGLRNGWVYVAAGFPAALLAPLRTALDWTVGGAVAVALTTVVLVGVSARRLGGRRSTVLSLGVALLPWLAVAGYHLNRSLGIHPDELLTGYALPKNLALVALAVAVWLVASWGVTRGTEGAPTRLGRLLPVVLALGVWAIVHVAGLVAFRPGIDKPTPDVVVLLVDALRADRLGSHGYERPTTPAIDALAADGIRFDQAIAHSTFTKTSVASLFSGRYPYQHGVYWGSRRENPQSVTSDTLSPREVTLAEVFRELGYLTSAWVQNSHLRGFMGFAQGFVRYHDQQGSIRRINRKFERFRRGPGNRYPYFAYLHYIDLHDPYLPEPPYAEMFGGSTTVYDDIDLAEWGGFLDDVRRGERTLDPSEMANVEALYDSQLRFIDDQIGTLLDDLEASGRYDDTLIVLTSDHGDAFGEHGVLSHSTSPYEELVRVPLIVKLPGNGSAGRVIEGQVGVVDILPTVLGILGAPVPPELPGCVRVGEKADDRRDEDCSFTIIEIAEDEGREPTVAVRTDEWKYLLIDGAPDELYHLPSDPGERDNLLASDPPLEIAAELERRALAAVAQRVASEDRIELDEKTIKELKALGYL